ncbi:hypothetical protein LTR85_008300 [Meristemomyces frigidus]|nr:hypothetical protein LTR85_008300 [Meristemomyces frigidus]
MAKGPPDRPKSNRTNRQHRSNNSDRVTINYNGAPRRLVADTPAELRRHGRRARRRAWCLTIESFPDGTDHIKLRRPVGAGPLMLASDYESRSSSSDASSTSSKPFDKKSIRSSSITSSDSSSSDSDKSAAPASLANKRSKAASRKQSSHSHTSSGSEDDPTNSSSPAGSVHRSHRQLSTDRPLNDEEYEDDGPQHTPTPNNSTRDDRSENESTSESVSVTSKSTEARGSLDDVDQGFRQGGGTRKDRWRYATDEENAVTMGLEHSPLREARLQQEQLAANGGDARSTEGGDDRSNDYISNPRRSSRAKRKPSDFRTASVSATPVPPSASVRKPSTRNASTAGATRRDSNVLPKSSTLNSGLGSGSTADLRPSNQRTRTRPDFQKEAVKGGIRKASLATRSRTQGDKQPRDRDALIEQSGYGRNRHALNDLPQYRRNSEGPDVLTPDQADADLASMQEPPDSHLGGDGGLDTYKKQTKKSGFQHQGFKSGRLTAPLGGHGSTKERFINISSAESSLSSLEEEEDGDGPQSLLDRNTDAQQPSLTPSTRDAGGAPTTSANIRPNNAQAEEQERSNAETPGGGNGGRRRRERDEDADVDDDLLGSPPKRKRGGSQ